MSHFVYIVRCANDTLYTGYAVDVAARVEKHNKGKGAKYTRINGPVELLAAWEASNRVEALKLERKIKSLSRPQKLALITGMRELPAVAQLPASAMFKKQRKRTRIRKRRKTKSNA